MNLDRLREVELDAVASRPQYPFDRRKNERVEHQRRDMRRSLEQAAEPLRAAAVEIAFVKGRCSDHRLEVAGKGERQPDLGGAEDPQALGVSLGHKPVYQTGHVHTI